MIGRVFMGRYETRRQLGEGGMGRVYLARQLDLGREVVVKVMHEQIAADPKFRDRFLRETLLMARFQHPGAVTLYDATLDDPLGPCIIMEYVKGVNLESLLLRNKRMSAPRVGRIIGELCEVLQAAHDEGIIHRDLKPANLMVVDADTPRERIKVMDFGLAKLIEGEPTTRKVTDTNVDFAVGTPGYICPEQVRGEEMDHRGDLYSVGVMMYELLTGRLPFNGPTSMDILLAHATEYAPTFGELGLTGWVPTEIEELVFDTLAKDPADRPQTARELAERFDTALNRAQVKAESRSMVPPRSHSELRAPASHAGLTFPHPPASVVATPPPASALTQTGTSRDNAALPFHMEAWMPESIAIMKLRGFVHDAGGEVVESVPGLIKVRLGGRKTPTGGPLSWLGLRRSASPIDVELHLHHLDPARDNSLTVHVLFRPSHPALLTDRNWRQRCTQVFIELRSYLMGRAPD
ncbi:serine/threonine protein kinase [Gemmata sp. JC673]|uniref:Serine/threonine protein kinase n=1 Tax=Gemmata algarum TaxID=2975278 RepID=A0ABU5EWC9_9BACT|nr:serine/threonine-protein kinase [Gemmata algarum]MDY3559608.1 serine/threonine protein kinase [Gemmata algarum]